MKTRAINLRGFILFIYSDFGKSGTLPLATALSNAS